MALIWEVQTILTHWGLNYMACYNFVQICSARNTWPCHGLVQDCSISIANALEILQSCTKPSMCSWFRLIAWCQEIPSYYLNRFPSCMMPLPEPMLTYNWWTPVVKNWYLSHSRKCQSLKCALKFGFQMGYFIAANIFFLTCTCKICSGLLW